MAIHSTPTVVGVLCIAITDGSFHVCYVYKGALRRLMYTEVCIGLDIAHFLSLMYGFIMQQICFHDAQGREGTNIHYTQVHNDRNTHLMALSL